MVIAPKNNLLWDMGLSGLKFFLSLMSAYKVHNSSITQMLAVMKSEVGEMAWAGLCSWKLISPGLNIPHSIPDRVAVQIQIVWLTANRLGKTKVTCLTETVSLLLLSQLCQWLFIWGGKERDAGRTACWLHRALCLLWHKGLLSSLCRLEMGGSGSSQTGRLGIAQEGCVPGCWNEHLEIPKLFLRWQGQGSHSLQTFAFLGNSQEFC